MHIIAGMHRSGTSLVARLCYLAGTDMGDPRTFHPHDRWNPEGYFEQPAIHAVNMPLVNGPWGRAAYLWLPSRRTILARGRRRREQIRQTAAQFCGKVVKDPRFCLTLPAWLAHGARVDWVIVCLRHPLAVAQSLWRRNRLPFFFSYHLWQVHLERLLSQPLSFRFLMYDRLMSSESFADEFGILLKSMALAVPAERVRELYLRAVRPDINHSKVEGAAPLPRSVEALWEDLQRRHAGQAAGSQAA